MCCTYSAPRTFCISSSPLREEIDVATSGKPQTPHFLTTVQAAALSFTIQLQVWPWAPIPASSWSSPPGVGGGRVLGVFLTTASPPVLCLGQAVHTQEGVLPKPSIKAEPGPVVRPGQPVTILCWGPAGADTFRLEYKDRRYFHWDERSVSQRGSHWAEARFPIYSVNEITAGSYFCLYHDGSSWSQHSEILELKVASEDVSSPPSGLPQEVTPTSTRPVSQTAPASQNYTVGNCVRISLAGVVLLILVGILAEAGHTWHRWPHGPQGWTQGSSCQKD
ncbi:leukocyte-associated immunoglobulin-like receptor 2 [Sturnira hondurensis]|uniref:leukocyte-associated immunoglobulin-like receptor 2 n=1 Tax=Sturnira hondurensis TaxID=192404 RepID=UPI00187977AE|nr:leukocyte-associated immunoglobulin-like receptor 2 [Sturnira hondurensis]